MSVPESAQAGSAVGRIQAKDRDEGVNAEMTYRIIDGDGRDTFKISNDPTNMFGIITIKKVPANTVSIEESWTQQNPIRFLYRPSNIILVCSHEYHIYKFYTIQNELKYCIYKSKFFLFFWSQC